MKKHLLLFAMILLPLTANADDSGTCGENVSWTYVEENKTLIISGIGEMMDFSLKKIPWKAYSESIKAVIIEEGVTHIGSGAFYGCENLTSVDIPQSVTTIGGRPFGNCKSLTSITIPSSVTSIGAYAFDNCSSLNKVNISSLSAWCKIKFEDRISNPLSWARYLYLNDELVEDLIIPDEVSNIGDYSFYACNGLKSVTFHDGVTSIGKASFQSCERITSINVPNNVNPLGEYNQEIKGKTNVEIIPVSA